MMVVCHHLNPDIPADMAFADSRIRPVHHGGGGPPARHGRHLDDVLGRPGDGAHRRDDHAYLADRTRHEVPVRPTARRPAERESPHDPQGQRPLLQRGQADAQRQLPGAPVRRQVHGQPVDHARHRRSRRFRGAGRLADLVLWEPKFFGVKTHMVLKGGRSPTRRSATPTPPSRRRSLTCRGPCGLHRPCPGSNSVNFAAPGVADRLNTRFVITQDSSKKVTTRRRRGSDSARSSSRSPTPGASRRPT